MPAPGQNVITAIAPPPKGLPTATGVGFATGQTERGSNTEPIRLKSMQDFINQYGERSAAAALTYDAVESAFREGLSEMWFSRVIGPGFVTASLILKDVGAGESLVVKARSPGEWSNGATAGIKVQVIAGKVSGFRIVVFFNAIQVEESGDLLTQAAAIAWAEYSNYIRITLGVTALVPVVVAATNLAGGTDDKASITGTHWLNAQNLFTADLGPGQVAQFGRTTEEAHTQLLEHAAKNNRFALCDPPDTKTIATLRALTAPQRAKEIARWGGLWAPWIRIPGTVPLTSRLVPPSAIVMGKMAAADAVTSNPNQPAAATYGGECGFAIGKSQTNWTDLERQELNEEGINVIRVISNVVTIYGYRTLVSPITAPTWLNAANQRLYMAIAAKAGVIAGGYVFAQLDGAGAVDSRFKSQLVAMLLPYWELGALYGETPKVAFNVETGPLLNTVAVAEKQELLATITLKMSPDAENVTITIVKAALTGSVV